VSEYLPAALKSFLSDFAMPEKPNDKFAKRFIRLVEKAYKISPQSYDAITEFFRTVAHFFIEEGLDKDTKSIKGKILQPWIIAAKGRHIDLETNGNKKGARILVDIDAKMALVELTDEMAEMHNGRVRLQRAVSTLQSLFLTFRTFACWDYIEKAEEKNGLLYVHLKEMSHPLLTGQSYFTNVPEGILMDKDISEAVLMSNRCADVVPTIMPLISQFLRGMNSSAILLPDID